MDSLSPEKTKPRRSIITHLPLLTKIYQISIPYVLLLPAGIAVFGILAYPIAELIHFSFLDWSFGKTFDTAKWAGFSNYIWLFSSNSPFLHALKLTLIYLVTSVSVELILGLIIALLLNKEVFGRSLLVTGFMIPTVLMPVMVGMMWRLYFYQNGVVSYFLRTFLHLEINWYGATWAMPAVILVEVWKWTPFYVVSLLAGIQALPQSIFEAASVEGASYLQKVRYLTIPLLKPIIVVCVTMRAVNIIRAFDVIYVMHGGGPGSATEVLGLSIYRQLFLARSIGRSSALSFITLSLSMSITFILIRFLYKSREVKD